MRFSSRLRFLAGLLLTAVSLYLALRSVDFSAIGRTLAEAHLWPAVLGMLTVMLSLLLKSLRWYVLLLAEPAAPGRTARRFVTVASSFLASQLVNAVYPVRMGEVGRIAVVGAPSKDYAFVTGTIAVEKVLDLLAFLGLILLFPLVSPRPPAASAGPDLLPEMLSPGSMFFLMVLILLAAPAVYWVSRRLRNAPRGLPERLNIQTKSLLAGMSTLRRPRTLAVTLLLTLLIWLVALLTNYFGLRALDLDLPFSASLLVLLILQVGISAPSLPGKVGVFEYACQLALSFYALAPETGLSYGILLHAVVYLPMIVFGLPAIWLASQVHTPPVDDGRDRALI